MFYPVEPYKLYGDESKIDRYERATWLYVSILSYCRQPEDKWTRENKRNSSSADLEGMGVSGLGVGSWGGVPTSHKNRKLYNSTILSLDLIKGITYSHASLHIELFNVLELYSPQIHGSRLQWPPGTPSPPVQQKNRGSIPDSCVVLIYHCLFMRQIKVLRRLRRK